ncbi:MAG: hypothetical protein CME64_05010 [Halobacteriovoraceae bacterium]|nr:hypothetical protein [Halobacteriovoraceae bacterium]|tara:strand:+ start:338054 stop:338614 length:561 start_codon:yes stop_codon:yes gene_type:complete
MDYLQPKFYRFSEDSLWLAKVAANRKTDAGSILDIGCGSGVVGIETVNRLKSPESLSLIEPQAEFLEFIENNLELIEKDIKVQVYNSKLENFKSDQRFDLILSNPPYFNPNDSRPSKNINRLRCRTFQDNGLLDFALMARGFLSPGGELYILGRKENTDVDKLIKNYGFKVLDQFKDVLLLNFIHE